MVVIVRIARLCARQWSGRVYGVCRAVRDARCTMHDGRCAGRVALALPPLAASLALAPCIYARFDGKRQRATRTRRKIISDLPRPRRSCRPPYIAYGDPSCAAFSKWKRSPSALQRPNPSLVSATVCMHIYRDGGVVRVQANSPIKLQPNPRGDQDTKTPARDFSRRRRTGPIRLTAEILTTEGTADDFSPGPYRKIAKR